jgi:hypothetical protein
MRAPCCRQIRMRQSCVMAGRTIVSHNEAYPIYRGFAMRQCAILNKLLP